MFLEKNEKSFITFFKNRFRIKSKQQNKQETFEKEKAYAFLQEVGRFGVTDWKTIENKWYEKQLQCIVASNKVSIEKKTEAFLYLAQIYQNSYLSGKSWSHVENTPADEICIVNIKDIITQVENLLNKDVLTDESEAKRYLNQARICAILCAIGLLDDYFYKASEAYQQANKLNALLCVDEMNHFHLLYLSYWREKNSNQLISLYEDAVNLKNRFNHLEAFNLFKNFIFRLSDENISFDKKMYTNLCIKQLCEIAENCMVQLEDKENLKKGLQNTALQCYQLVAEHSGYEAYIALAYYYLNPNTHDFLQAASYFQSALDKAPNDVHKNVVFEKLREVVKRYPSSQELESLLTRLMSVNGEKEEKASEEENDEINIPINNFSLN